MQAAEDTHRSFRRGKSLGPNIKALLVALLASVVFAAGCGGGEETKDDSAEETTTKDKARKEDTKRDKESTRGEGSGREVTVSFEGDSGIEFSGTCSVGDEEESFEGQVPESFTYDLGSQQLECEIQKQAGDGTLEALLTGPGDRIRQQTDSSGGTINLTYSENGGYSSSTSSSGSSSSVNQVVSSSSSGSSSSSSSSTSSR